jgi:hypothetical protein
MRVRFPPGSRRARRSTGEHPDGIRKTRVQVPPGPLCGRSTTAVHRPDVPATRVRSSPSARASRARSDRGSTGRSQRSGQGSSPCGSTSPIAAPVAQRKSPRLVSERSEFDSRQRLSGLVVKGTSRVTTDHELGVRFPPRLPRSRRPTERTRGSEPRNARSTRAESTTAGNANRGGRAHAPRDTQEAQVLPPLPAASQGQGGPHKADLGGSTPPAATFRRAGHLEVIASSQGARAGFDSLARHEA